MGTTLSQVADDYMINGIDGHLDKWQQYTRRANLERARLAYRAIPLHHQPNLSNWIPIGFSRTSEAPIVYTPSIPGRIDHPDYGNCYIHARCSVSREHGVRDPYIYLVTLVNSVMVDGLYTKPKRRRWYEIPGALSVIGDELPGFCAPVNCMVDYVDYDRGYPENTKVVLVHSKAPGRPFTLPLDEVINTRDPNIKIAFENFKSDNASWVASTNIEHQPVVYTDDNADDNDTGD